MCKLCYLISYLLKLLTDKTLMFMLLSSVRFASPYSNYRGRDLILNYTICATSNAKAAFLSSAGLFWQRPTNIPDRTAFRHPVWSTWAMYKRAINETKILQLARDIKERGFQHSHLQIDDGWSTHYGDFRFNPEKWVFSRFNCTNAFISFHDHMLQQIAGSHLLFSNLTQLSSAPLIDCKSIFKFR